MRDDNVRFMVHFPVASSTDVAGGATHHGVQLPALCFGWHRRPRRHRAYGRASHGRAERLRYSSGAGDDQAPQNSGSAPSDGSQQEAGSTEIEQAHSAQAEKQRPVDLRQRSISGYCFGMPAFSITFAHFSMSLRNRAVNSSGVLAIASIPTSPKRLRT